MLQAAIQIIQEAFCETGFLLFILYLSLFYNLDYLKESLLKYSLGRRYKHGFIY